MSDFNQGDVVTVAGRRGVIIRRTTFGAWVEFEDDGGWFPWDRLVKE